MKGRDELPFPCAILTHERGFLEGLTAMLPDGARAVNVGALAGCSTIAMLRGGRDVRDFHLWSIDTEPRPEEWNYANVCGLTGRLTQVLGDSKVVGREWSGWVDLVFVDGDHTYEGCMGDIRAWEPHIALGGFLVFHDYEGLFESVTEAVDQWFVEAKSRKWMRVARVDLTVAFKRGGFAEMLACHGVTNTVSAKFMRGEA